MNLYDTSEELIKDPLTRLAMSSMMMKGIQDACMHATSGKVLIDCEHKVSYVPKVKDQKNTGSCWIQSGISFLECLAQRAGYDLIISSHHIHFCDKFEKCRVFLSRMNHMRSASDERLLHHYLEGDGPLSDGGTWSMLVHIIETYGIIPETEVVETHAGNNTFGVNEILKQMMRKHYVDGGDDTEFMNNVTGVLLRCLGKPFQREVRVKRTDGTTVTLTPHQLRNAIAPTDFLKSLTCFAHTPHVQEDAWAASHVTNHKEKQHRFYCVRDVRKLSSWTKNVLKYKNMPVPFTADVNFMRCDRRGVMDPDQFSYETMLGIVPFLGDKAERIKYKCTSPNHAMMFVGVDVDENDNPIRYLVLNSWGTKNNMRKGLYVMSQKWFEEYVFEVTLPPMENVSVPDSTECIHLKPWDVFSVVA